MTRDLADMALQADRNMRAAKRRGDTEAEQQWHAMRERLLAQYDAARA